MKSLMLEYLKQLGDKHQLKGGIGLRQTDLRLRQAIGKTNDIKVAKASHHIVRSMEAGEWFCRVCGKDLQVVGEARINDYLVLRHPFCKAPICFVCSKNKPDAFYLAFKKGCEQYMQENQMLGLLGATQ